MSVPDPNLIIMTTAKPKKIYFREQFGYFQSIRRKLAIGLMLIFVLLPFVRYQSQAAFNIDVAEQKIRFFAVTLYPQDLLIVVLIFILAAFLLFYVTRIYGRVWCGYTCPQTIWMLMFTWVERRIEGSHQHSKALDKAELSIKKVIKKGAKHSIWLFIAFLTACTFMSYFVPVEVLYTNLFNFDDYLLLQNWILFFTACTYINAGWIKDKMCLHICPYARFQSALFDKTTKLVSYDAARGENRGPRKRSQAKPEGLGDCVNCYLCVDVCPVGIDIRNGLQYECINCGLCVDACDAVMSKFNYAKGLIKYTRLVTPASRWKQHLAYGSVTVITLLMLVGWGVFRTDFEVNISRDRNALYRVDYNDRVENTYTIKLLNKSQQEKSFAISLLDNTQFTLDEQPIIRLPGEQSAIKVISVFTDKFVGKQKIAIQITDLSNQTTQTIDTQYYTPRQ